MFGRSGQMFPRRTFHDAIYEEEYGSDNEEECCRCRGLSAILCWFLSVIILVGLAATVVLTVFFILRSRTLLVKPDADLDVEMYGKDQNLFESNAGGGTSKELIGSNESPIAVNESGGGGNSKGKKSNLKSNGRGPPDATKNDVDADVNEEQNAITDSSEDDQAEDASVSHNRNHHTQNGRQNRLQPYSPKTTTIGTTTTEAPVEASEEELESSSEEEPEQSNGEGSSLFNLFSGPRNPSYSAPKQEDEVEVPEEDDPGAVISAESSADYKSTRYNDGSPVQQVLFTESPKVTVTTPNPYNNRRNLQTTRFPTGRTSFSSTTTTVMPPAPAQEESEEEEEEEEPVHEDEEQPNEDNNEEEGDDDENAVNHENDETSREEENGADDESNKDNEKSSEEDTNKLGLPASSPQITTTVYDQTALSGESEMGSDSGESQLKQMLLDSIPPHGVHKDDADDVSNEAVASSEFNLSQKPYTTTAINRLKPQSQKPIKHNNRQDTLTRIISRNFTRQGQGSTVEEPESSTGAPSVTTIGPAGHRYDYTMTPVERTKLKIKSGESTEQEVVVTKPTQRSRFRSTTSRPIGSPKPPSTAVPRTRGTTLANSAEYGIKLGDKRGSVESPIDIVPSPDLSRKDPQQQQDNSLEGVDLNSGEDTSKTSSEQQFLDVLVGSEDHKSLVTKNTQDGIVTSAILPPWYDSNGSNSTITDVLATNGTSLSNAVAKVEEDDGEAMDFGENATKRKSTELNIKELAKDQSGSEFERLVNMFSKQEQSSEEQTASPPPRFGFKKQKPIVLKKPGGSVNSRYIPSVPGRANLFPTKHDTSEHESSETIPTPTPSAPSTTVSAITGDVGRTGALPTSADVEEAVATSGYYPESTRTSDKVVEHHLVESERLASDEVMDSNEQEPSHVIDVNFEEAANSPAQIIIDQDSSAPMEDEEGDFVEDDDYEAYEESPSTMSMSASTPNENFVPVPNEYVRGSGIRKPVSSEESLDAQASASSLNATSTIAPSTLPPQVSTSAVPMVIRRPAYTREEILKSSVRPSPESIGGDNHLDDSSEHKNVATVSAEGTASDEFEEYEDDNYEGGSVEQAATGSVEQWSNEKVDHRWSAPDKVRDAETTEVQEQFVSEELVEPEESVAHANLQNRLDNKPIRMPDASSKPNITFQAPLPVTFHENKLSFSAPIPNEGQYHSKDGWRPVITESSRNPVDPPEDPYYGGSQEANSAQVSSFEPEQNEPAPVPQQELYQEPLPQQPQQQIQPMQSVRHQLKPPSIIPPQVSATIKFPDSEEDHEDRHHHSRNRLRQPMHFDRSKYMGRPVTPPIVMRRHPHSTGPFPPSPLNNRQGPPPPPPHQQRQQLIPQASQQNPQYEHPPPPPPPPNPPQVRPPISPMNRNFHMRHNPLRRFNFGGPPQAQPRSGGNIKWPTDENVDPARDNGNANAGKRQNIESIQTEVSNNKKRRRRAVGFLIELGNLLFS